ncbi:MAG: oligopeptide/dipeptide ABC transporter ATP-binding protein [Erysipelotrichaceae bacterium]|nr:oligopeptide/dipeptide ABC transporter ATP-binding protein [Erysipelotrichaceae bacterium]
MSEIKPIITVNNLTKYYYQKKKVTNKAGKKVRHQTIKAVDGISFSLSRGEILGVIGESGCGKSTLARVLIALENATAGEILLDGVNSFEALKKDRLAFRRKCQIVFQNPFDTFDPRYTIEKIMISTMQLHNIGSSKEEQRQICIDILEKAGLSPAEDYFDRYSFELSGGQLQRISILRSMLLNPQFLIADEPVSMLDVSVRADIINMLTTLVKEKNAAMVFISHDILTTRYISDKVAVMYLGRIVEMGPTDEVIHHPRHPYTQALISSCASLNPLEHRTMIEISGEPPTPVDTGPGCYFAPRCFKACEKCFTEYPDSAIFADGHLAACHCLEK